MKGFLSTVRATIAGISIPAPEPEKEEAPTASSAEEESPYKQGYTFTVSPQSNGDLRKALDAAFNYRGIVTVTNKDGSEAEGYLSNVFKDTVELWPAKDERKVVPIDAIATLSFTGRDPAEGKSWEAWVKKQDAKKAEEAKSAAAA